jgi:UDP-N-acetyl-D-glucosamine dehydrogenase
MAPMKIGVIGLGYVGLPLLVAFAEAGSDVVGFDSDADRVEALAAGHTHVEDISDERLAPLRDRVEASVDADRLSSCDALIICVPTPLTDNREPDLHYLTAAAETVASVLRRGQVVVLESTTYPGTTRDVLLPILERSGLRSGEDFQVAFSPERIDPGRTDYTLRNTPKLVGGLDAASTAAAASLYGTICDDVVVVSTPEVAELAKLLENVFRSVNIAFVNELSQLCDRLGIDVWEVVDAAATKPFGFMQFKPGPGMGGHCLPVDPFYLAHKAREVDFQPEFIELAGKINQTQPAYCVDLVSRALTEGGKALDGSRVVLIGVSYKGGVGDTRESPALRIIELLRERGAIVSYHDPHVPEVPGFGLSSVELAPALAECDVAVLVTVHPEFDLAELASAAPVLLDLRGATRALGPRANVRLL